METSTHIDELFSAWNVEWLQLELKSIEWILLNCPVDYDDEKYDVRRLRRLRRLKINVLDKINILLKKEW